MDHLRKLLIAAVCLAAGPSIAGYAELAAPERFSGGPGTWKFAPSANDTRYGAVAYQNGAVRVPVPGSPTKLPVAYRFAANAPRVAAAALFLHPGIRTAVGIASWLGIAGIVWDAVTQKWTKTITTIETQCGNGPMDHSSAMASYQGTGPYGNPHQVTAEVILEAGTCKLKVIQSAQQWGGSWRTSETIVSTWAPITTGATGRPLTKEEFERELAPEITTPGVPSTMPETVPWELPFPTPLPVEQPVINPVPGPNPQPRPHFEPSGDPVVNPNYNPNAPPSPNNQPFIQPGTQITPSPTPTQPFRVDTKPVTAPRPTADPNPDPNPDPESPPPETTPKPEEQQSLCEKHPDIVACQKLGAPPEVTPVPNEDRNMTITKDNGWGQENGTCPAPRTVQVAGISLSMPFDLLCDFANGIRPIIVGLAWLSAAFAFLGIGRRE